MPDRADYPRSEVMSRVRSRNTAPERKLRAALHAMGIRFRLDQPIRLDGRRPITPDLTFRSLRVAVFVDGCFWHGCPAHGRMPSSSGDYWGPKLQRNVARDLETAAALRRHGWTVVRLWEHDDPAAAAAVVRDTLAAARAARYPAVGSPSPATAVRVGTNTRSR